MKLLIIGGTGLISTPITRMLLAQGYSVTHLNRGKKRAEPPVTTIVADRTDSAALKAALHQRHFNCVIDMACYTPEDARNAVAALQDAVGQYIFCSTVDVYTKPAPGYPITKETPRQPNPEFSYAFGKAQCEEIFMQHYTQNGFPVTILRPAYTYREGEGVGILHTLGWSTDYLARIRAAKPIITHGDGNFLWVACNADDVARAFMNAVGNTQAIGKAYHATGEKWLTWNQYHQIVAQVLGCELPEIIHILTHVLYKLAPEHSFWAKVNFQYNNLFDNTLARQELKFTYTVSWLEGARRMIDWLEAQSMIHEADRRYDAIVEAWRRCLNTLSPTPGASAERSGR